MSTDAQNVPAATPAIQDEHPELKVWVGNIPYVTEEAKLKEHFAEIPAEKIVVAPNVQIKGKRRAKGGFAHLYFKDAETAKAAVAKFNNSTFEGRTIHLDHARTKAEQDEINVKRNEAVKERKQARKTAQKEAKDAAAPVPEGEKKDTTKKRNKRNKKKAAASTPDGTTTPAANPTDAAVAPKEPKKKAAPKPKKKREVSTAPLVPSDSVVFLADLPEKWAEADLKALFEGKGIKVPEGTADQPNPSVIRTKPWVKKGKDGEIKKTPRSKGYAFVDCGSADAQKKAIELFNGYATTIGEGAEAKEYKITAKIANNKPVPAPKDAATEVTPAVTTTGTV